MTKSKEKIMELLAEVLGLEVDDISLSDRFKEDLHMSSINISDFGHNLVDAGFTTTPEEASQHETVGELIDSLSDE